MPIDPISATVGGVQSLTGLIQSIAGGRQAKRAEKDLMYQIDRTPQYSQNKSILDFYNQALNRYNVSPTDSAMYKRQMQNVGRNTATGINALQDRRSGQAGISSILRAANDASLNAEVAAEGRRDNMFGQLGGAAQLKTSEDDKAFQQNQVLPFELRTNLQAMKLQGANQRTNSGMQNIFGGFQTALGGITPKKK